MNFRRLTSCLAVGSLLALATAPVLAENGKEPPGAPCDKGNGNPCNGNPGNSGQQGNGGGRGGHGGHPPTIDIPVAPVSGRGAFITQIGEANRASAAQSGPNALVAIHQKGDRNRADVTQSGTRSDFADVVQLGDKNSAVAVQSGTGQNVLWVAQAGWRNDVTAAQDSNGGFNGAILAQAGYGNQMRLTQDGGDNKAILTQTGNDNAMSATQNGDGNRLVWNQVGSGLRDLGIVQNGGQAIQITQTGTGR